MDRSYPWNPYMETKTQKRQLFSNKDKKTPIIQSASPFSACFLPLFLLFTTSTLVIITSGVKQMEPSATWARGCEIQFFICTFEAKRSSYVRIWVFPKKGESTQNGCFCSGFQPYEQMDDLGGKPIFLETPISTARP